MVLVTTLVALIVALAAIVGYDLRAYHRILVSDMSTQAELLGRTTAPALAFDDPRVAKENLGLLRFRPLVSSAAIYNARGGLFATYARADNPRGFPKLPEPDSARVDERELVVFKRIVSDGEILGTVFLRADYELFDRVYDYLGIAAVVLIAAMLVALLMSSWMQNIVTRPILAIAQIAREVVGQRDYSRRAPKMSADEVGTLVDSFNDMLTEIDRRTREVEASNAKLAQEAEERSRVEREVLRLNAELENRVRDRTAQLETANRELESFSYSVSHDLRAPLRAIDGFGQALVDDFPDNLPGDAKRYLSRIRASTRHMAQLIEDLLKLARVAGARPFLSATTGRASTWPMPTSFSERFSACIRQPSTPAPASGLRPCSASCTGTAGASGPKGKSAREPCFSSRWRSLGRRLPLPSRSRKGPMDRTPIQVLFVEDFEVDVELALRSLEQGGFEVSWERVDLEEDLRRVLGSSKPQAILSDFSMPRFDGVDALRLVKEIAPGIPFIFLSGTIGEERAIEAIRLGATDYVLKNNMRRLGTVVRRALSEAGERERGRHAAEERARLVQILEATSDYVGMTDPAGTITYLNAAGRKLTGSPGSGGGGRELGEIYPAWARELIEREGTPAASRAGVWNGETAILGADGTEIPVSQVIIAHRGPDGEIRFFSTIARDIRERKAYEARLQYLANYDPLTGLPNRDLLGDRTLQAVAHAPPASPPAARPVLNLGRLQPVNQSYSHGAGDTLLHLG